MVDDKELLEAMRAQVEVGWKLMERIDQLVARLDRALTPFERPASDPRNTTFDYNKPR